MNKIITSKAAVVYTLARVVVPKIIITPTQCFYHLVILEIIKSKLFGQHLSYFYTLYTLSEDTIKI